MISQEKASTSIQGIISEKFPTIGLGRGSPKNPQKCSVRERRSLNTCQDHIVLSISQVQILLCPFLFSLLTLQLHRIRNQVGKSQEKQKRWVRKEKEAPLSHSRQWTYTGQTGGWERWGWGLCR